MQTTTTTVAAAAFPAAVVNLAAALSVNKQALTFTIVTRRQAATFKTCGETIVKESTMVGLFTDYADLAPVADAVAEGVRTAPELPKHIARSVNVGGVRFWEGNNGKFYLPVPLADVPARTQWYQFEDEKYVPVGYIDIQGFLLASEKPRPQDRAALAEKGQAPFVAVAVENIIAAYPNG